LNSAIRQVASRADAGAASAMAAVNIPQAFLPGKTMIGGGVGFRGSEGAIAFGASHMLDDGHTTVKGSFTYDSQQKVSGGLGFGVQF